MINEKIREEFEKSPRFRGMDFQRASDHPDYYLSPYANGAWEGWQASRAAVSIKLPPEPTVPEDPEGAIDDSHMDAYHSACRMRRACVAAVEAAGLKVVS